MTSPEQSRPPVALRRLEQNELYQVLDHSPDPTIIVDASGRIVFASLQVEQVLGFERKDLLGLGLEVLIPERFHPTHAGHIRDFFARPSARPMGQGVDLWARGRDGREIPVEISLSWIGESDERLVVASLRDVSTRRRARDELEQVNRELARRTREQEAVVNDLRVFAQAASHDLQAPLRQVAQFLSLLDRRHGDSVSAEGREYLRCAMESAARLSMMVKDVLEYSRLGATEQRLGPVDLSDLLDRVLERIQVLLDEVGARITRDPLPCVLADASQLAQLLQNLITNALCYKSDAALQVHVSASFDGERWAVSVRDNGIGIAPSQHAKIFDMFQRSVGNEERPGSGVGLAICKRVVERHQGRIWVDSEPGHGATFSFTLPALEGSRGEGEAEQAEVRAA